MLDNKADFSDIWEYSHETAWIMGYIYENFEAFYLAVCKAEGTRYESFLHDIAKRGKGLLIRPIINTSVRLVFYKGITRRDAERAAAVIREIDAAL